MSLVNYEHNNGIATITLSNPPENRLSPPLMKEFSAAVEDLAARDDTRVVYLKTEGDHYCFGGDFTPWLSLNAETAAAARVRDTRITSMLAGIPAPIVTAVQGTCRGGGFEFALLSDIIIAADDAEFSHPESTLGIFTLLGGVQRVAERVGRTRAIQWAMTNEIIKSPYAQEIGLINEVVPAADLYSRADAWVQLLAGGPTLVHAAHKKLLRAWSDGGVAAADALIPQLAAECFMSEDGQGALKVAIDAQAAGLPRPKYAFQGR